MHESFIPDSFTKKLFTCCLSSYTDYEIVYVYMCVCITWIFLWNVNYENIDIINY